MEIDEQRARKPTKSAITGEYANVATDAGRKEESLIIIQIEARPPLYTKPLACRDFLAQENPDVTRTYTGDHVVTITTSYVLVSLTSIRTSLISTILIKYGILNPLVIR